jgi:hypothetical protein
MIFIFAISDSDRGEIALFAEGHARGESGEVLPGRAEATFRNSSCSSV